MNEVFRMLKAIHASEDKQAALKKSVSIVQKLRKRKLNKAAKTLENGVSEFLTYYDFPSRHWQRIRTNNPLERIMKEIRRRTRVVGSFPDGKSAIMLVGARLRHIAGTKWGSKRYLNMNLLREMKVKKEHVA